MKTSKKLKIKKHYKGCYIVKNVEVVYDDQEPEEVRIEYTCDNGNRNSHFHFTVAGAFERPTKRECIQFLKYILDEREGEYYEWAFRYK